MGSAGPTGHAQHARNRRRTGSTAAALVIGVTLVSTLVVGGMSTKATFGAGLEQHFPVDVAVNLGTAADQDVIEEIRDIDGVATAVLAYHGSVVDDDAELYIVDPSSLSALLGEQAPPVVAGRVTVPENYPGQSVQVQGLTTATRRSRSRGSRAGPTSRPLTSATGSASPRRRRLCSSPWPPTRAAPTSCASGKQVAEALDVATDEVIGSAVERGLFAQVIDVLLLTAVGVLLIAVLIALIGVSNTISLSVIERRRENSRARALGLSLASRALLAFEAVLISVVAALIGLGLGGGPGHRRDPTHHRRLLIGIRRRLVDPRLARHPRRHRHRRDPLGAGSRPVAPHGCPRSKGSSRRPDPAGSRARPQW